MNNNYLKIASQLCVGGFTLCAQPLLANDADQKMNVLFLLADDLRWNSIGCVGPEFIITPNIDKLSQEGVLFSNAYVTTGVSCVSRASIFTGQYMSRHGINRFGKNLTPAQFSQSYPGVLRSNGYWSGIVGKYGLGHGRASDFDVASVYEGSHWLPADGKSKITRFKNGYTRIGRDSIHVTERNVQDALKFLKNKPSDQPFCLSVGFYAPHAEDKHPEQYRYQAKSEGLYQDVDIPVSEKATEEYFKRLPYFLQADECEGRVRWHWRFDTPEKYQVMMKKYYRMVSEVDEAIGRIIAELKRTGDYENTLIVFMGDNGYFHSEKQLADKWFPYDEALRVPLIICDPRLNKKGVKVDEMALNIDLAPTIIAATGIDVPESMQGQDLYPIYGEKRAKRGWREDFFYEHPTINGVSAIPSSQGVVSADSKYILWPDYGVEEYFNLKRDPTEFTNEIESKRYQKAVTEIRERFEQLKARAK